ncbi:hypothetical protein LuPra_01731 [Luteitalea pratensis]|uniref:Uncharacterized protein n=1 Tax=Luteitalea pratensis TaxID=1855912 RepID=A0A143PJV2_LUTPR|nr:hypothetical protein LuPra_01731 [Luteitalea pratensis]
MAPTAQNPNPATAKAWSTGVSKGIHSNASSGGMAKAATSPFVSRKRATEELVWVDVMHAKRDEYTWADDRQVTLAQRSPDAVKDTAGLIEESIARSQRRKARPRRPKRARRSARS